MEGVKRVRWITQMASLVALATILHTIEGIFLPHFLWIRVGVANTVTLLALRLFGLKEAITVACLRSLLGGIIGGIFLTPAFILGLSGSVVAALVMGLFYRYPLGLSTIGISILGAVANNLTQLSIITFFIIRHIGAIVYLPFLMLLALFGGSFNGFVAKLLFRYLPGEVIR